MKKQILLAVCALVAVLLMGTAGTSYAIYMRHSEADWVRTVGRVLPLPAAKVGSTRISYNAYLEQMDAVRVFVSGPAAASVGAETQITPEVRTQALERLIRTASVEQFAREKGIEVTPLDVDRAFDLVRQEAGASSTREDIQDYLKQAFGWTEAEFKHNVVRPALLEDLLKKKDLEEGKKPEVFTEKLDQYMAGSEVKRYVTFK